MNLIKDNFNIKAFDDESGVIEGYGSVFGNVDSYGDIIDSSAFDDTISSIKSGNADSIKMLWQHNPTQPIGVWTDVSKDEFGLRIKGRLTRGVAQAEEALKLLKDKAINGLSIGFIIPKDGQKIDRKRNANIITKAILKEVSIVTFPANQLARLSNVKNEHDLASYKRQVEQILRDGGLTKEDALQIIARGVYMLKNEKGEPALLDVIECLKTEINKTKNR